MSRTAALVALHSAVALFGFAALFGKWVALPPVEIVFGRTLVAAASLAVVLRVQRASSTRPSIGLALNGGLLALHWVTFFAAVQLAGVAIALLAFASFPVFVLAIESVEQRRAPRSAELTSIVVVVCGLILLVPEFRWSSAVVQGHVCGVVAGLTFAILTVRTRRRVALHGAVGLALWQNAFAALWLLPFVLIGLPSALRATLHFGSSGILATLMGAAMMAPTVADVALLAVLGVACTALSHTLFIASMHCVSAHTASVVSVLEPVYGIVLAILLIGERPDARTLAGMLLIFAAALLATRHANR